MDTIINAFTQLFNILIWGTMTPESNTLTINFIKIQNFEIKIKMLSTIFAHILIAMATIIMIYYLFDILIILWKRFTK